MTLGWLQEDGTATIFGQAFAATATSGVFLWLATQRVKSELQIRDGFMVTAAFWIVLGIYGALPFLLSDAVDISVFDAIFESVSGLTTTGATVLVGLDHIPQSILLYRQLLQWLGGIGIIVLAVAVLPMLNRRGTALSCGKHRPRQRQQINASHYVDRKSAFQYLLRTHCELRAGVFPRGNDCL